MAVVFACPHNAGRSQMAAAICARVGNGRVRGRSAGTAPAAAVHPVGLAGLAARRPKGRQLDQIRALREAIERRVVAAIGELRGGESRG